MTYRYKILACRVIDGDSVEFTFDLGFRLSFKTICRMSHINAPEMSNGGAEAKEWLVNKLSKNLSEFEVETTKADKYGRWLVEIFYRVNGGWLSVNKEMIALNLAVPYEGGKR